MTKPVTYTCDQYFVNKTSNLYLWSRNRKKGEQYIQPRIKKNIAPEICSSPKLWLYDFK